ncbi:MAG TPA: hypothetical protein GYA07_03840 [Verrucomicrobia bacterium]|nr:hypothetical protein [Verrucomicrobiota bacterium]HOB33756.1 polymer-forming cytoskeletal protein [Verrucomicrobiota bacterium]HOP99218.1 polymer-forming cytoskeletal protein [Verrucomicrobiota bacterium]HPU57197.1 polymer-forming cytoskeletal protein [Verrucomicrobiota bacterium]
MPASKQDKFLLTCPHCGHQQPEPRVAFSTVCKKCGRHLRVQELLHPKPRAAPAKPEGRIITCFECGAELEVARTAESTMCRKCSRYVDLRDYRINNAASKNFKTKGSFLIDSKGYLFNSETIAADIVIKGRFLGKLHATNSLTIYSTAEIKGTLAADRLIIPEANHFRWNEVIRLQSGEIGGELAGDLDVAGTLVLKSTARFFGQLTAAHLVVEEGAVVVGSMRIGVK